MVKLEEIKKSHCAKPILEYIQTNGNNQEDGNQEDCRKEDNKEDEEY